MLKENKGITLVALVVTIIVLLILAGVTISLVVGNNGVVTRAQEAQKEQEKAYARDIVSTALKAVEIDMAANSSRYTDDAAKMTALSSAIGNASFTCPATAGQNTKVSYAGKSGTITVTVEWTNYTVTDVAQ